MDAPKRSTPGSGDRKPQLKSTLPFVLQSASWARGIAGGNQVQASKQITTTYAPRKRVQKTLSMRLVRENPRSMGPGVTVWYIAYPDGNHMRAPAADYFGGA